MEVERSVSLLQLMNDVGLMPSAEEEIKRTIIVNKLKEIVMDWAKRISNKRRLPSSCTEAASATIMTYGSYGLGVHSNESDIDALCVGPCFATMKDDFFIVLRNMIACTPEVSDLHCIKTAKVPIMRFNFDGISIDLSYAKLDIVFVPENVNVHDPSIFKNMDEISWRSFSRVFANKSILQLVPNLESYRLLLRFVKHWAKVRGIYGNFLGFLGGIHLAVLTAFICQRHPEDALYALISVFFKTFAFWPWPNPISLNGSELPPNNSSIQNSLMPIQIPCSPFKYCHSIITRSAFYRIREEFLRAQDILTKDAPRSNFDWKIFFQSFLQAKNYIRLIKIRLSSSHQDELQDWVGFVKSRIHYLFVKLEELHYFCDPNPTQYVDEDFPEPNVVFYWGLHAGGNSNIDHGSMKEDFMKNLLFVYERPIGNIELMVIRGYDLSRAKLKTTSKSIKVCWRIARSL